ncbi:MAG: hypothetical protein R3B74_06140 [Nitrospirales bacterium]|nr:hypothetical protein [Nitrospirales bacterium]
MTVFLFRLFIMAVLLFLGKPGLAQEGAPKEAPLPQRNFPVPKIEGYADWKFTDSLETLQNDHRLKFIEAGGEKCEFGKEEQRDRIAWPDCFYHATEIFQEPGDLFILVSQERIERIVIQFNRLDSESDSHDCASVMNAVVDRLVEKFGIPTSKNDVERQVFWESSDGGTVEFTNKCISEGRGMVLVVIAPTRGQQES